MEGEGGSRPDVDFDVVVVGAGLAGLAAGALCARLGLRCAVLEQADSAGGFTRALSRPPYVFEGATNLSGQGGPDMIYDHVLKLLGVRELCDFVGIDPVYVANYPGRRVVAPAGLDAFLDAHARAFPDDRRGLTEFVELCSRLRSEAHELPLSLSPPDIRVAEERFPTVFEHLFTTVSGALNSKVRSPEARAVITSLWQFIALPPSRHSLQIFAQFLSCTIEQPFVLRGGFRTFVQALAAGLERNSGGLFFGHTVDRLLVEKGRVVGVGLADGRTLRAGAVISNVDARVTYRHFLRDEALPRQVSTRLDRLRAASSIYVLYTVTSADIAEQSPATVWLDFPSYDHEASYSGVLAGRPGPLWISLPSLVDAGMAPAGQHVVVTRLLAPAAKIWEATELAGTFRAYALERLDSIFPGFQRRLEFLDEAAPVHLEPDIARDDSGAAASLDPSPAEMGRQLLGSRSPFGRLYLVGQWLGNPSILSALAAGVHAAQMVASDLAVPEWEETLALPMLPTFKALRTESAPG